MQMATRIYTVLSLFATSPAAVLLKKKKLLQRDITKFAHLPPSIVGGIAGKWVTFFMSSGPDRYSSDFWDDVLCLIKDIIGTPILVEPEIALFHLFPEHMP